MVETVPPPPAALRETHCTAAQYEALYARSLADPDRFWAEQARRIDWVKAPTRIANWSFDPPDIKWFEDGVLNLCHNCVDRHLPDRADDVAIVWEGDEPGTVRRLTYGELHAQVVRMANSLKALGAAQGDRVTLYMPMIPEAAVAMLACARIGAVHSVVFGGFSPEALHGRIEDCASRIVVTADGGTRAGKLVPLKANVDEAIARGAALDAVLVVRHLGNPIVMAAIGWTRSAPPNPPIARASPWARRIRSSSSTRRARPESPRAYSTRPAAMRSGPPPPSIMSSITGRASSSGARPTSAG